MMERRGRGKGKQGPTDDDIGAKCDIFVEKYNLEANSGF